MFVDCEIRQLNKNGEELCGDNIEIVNNIDNKVIVLSDGLGSGVKANILSTMTKKIAATLLSNGMDVEEVVETLINTLPVCKVRNIAYSTFTIAQIYNNGLCKLVEFDNPSAFFIKDGLVTKYDFKTLKISNNNIKVSEFTMNKGDMLIFSSDGLIHSGLGRMLKYGLGWGWERIAAFIEANTKMNAAPDLIAEKLISVAKELDQKKVGDDTSVVVIRLREAKELNIAIGPPENKDLDDELVKKIMNSKARKVVCGGTTSNIFASKLKKQIKVVIDKSISTTPPKAIIEGIDLVTEGIITLSQTLEIIDKIDNKPKYEVYIDSDALVSIVNENNVDLVQVINNNISNHSTYIPQNPAEELAIELKNADRITFITGKAVNPAHQNPNFPMQVILKPKLVKELKEKLEKSGKQVSIEYL